jgi:hypothetical protein
MLGRERNGVGSASGDRERRVRYGGTWFTAASALPLTRGELVRRVDLPGRRWRRAIDASADESRRAQLGTNVVAAAHALAMIVVLLVAGVRRPDRVRALMGLLLLTRSEHLLLSDSAAGQTLRLYFDRRTLGVLPLNQLCRGVLILPSEHSEYLRGRRRQAVRTNLRRAATAGITCEAVDRSSASEILATLSEHRQAPLPSDWRERWRPALAHPALCVSVALDRSGEPLAVSAVLVDDMVCLITFAVACSHDARWALHDHIVKMLIDRGVRYLVVEGGGAFGALGLSPSVQHYQHLLGYELRHLRPHAARPDRRGATLLRTHGDVGTDHARLAQPPDDARSSYRPAPPIANDLDVDFDLDVVAPQKSRAASIANR